MKLSLNRKYTNLISTEMRGYISNIVSFVVTLKSTLYFLL